MSRLPLARTNVRPLPIPFGLTADHGRGPFGLSLQVAAKDDDGVADRFEEAHRRGIRQFRSGRYVEAAASLAEALKLVPGHATAWSDLGAALTALRRYDEAMACFDKAIAIKPKCADTLNNRGNLLAALKRYEEALSSYDRALAVSHRLASVHNNRGLVLRQLGRLEEALASFDRAVAPRRNSSRCAQ